MEAVAVVTGASSGIGRALSLRLVDEGVKVLAVARRREALETLQREGGRIEAVGADLAQPAGRQAVREAVGQRPVAFLVHNAGVLEPIGPLADVSLMEWRHSQAVNVEAPLFLTQALLPRLKGGRVLHVSSGAAHHGYPGWGAYCVAKAGLHMLYQVLREELRARDVAVGSVRPGVVDTPMQTLIRRQTPERFPAVERFIGLKQAGQLRDPRQVADFLAWLLMRSPVEDFPVEEWDIGNPDHQRRWQAGA